MRLVLTAAALLMAVSAARAQTVEIELREAESRAPIAGAIVRLLAESRIVAQGLTSEQGRLSLRAPAAGSYRLKVDRIGWSGFMSDPLQLSAGPPVRANLLLPSVKRELPTLEVRGRSRCRVGQEEGPLVAALWDEIRKALTANLITQRQGSLTLHVREFERDVDPSERILRQWYHSSKLGRGQPFVSLPPELLAREGFVRLLRDSSDFAAPDAVLLLSDEFVSTHCFGAVGGEQNLVGLEFEPIPGRRVADVQGTLWVDRATSELRHIEYRYTGLEGMLERARLGGRVEFRRLPTGSWIVSYWHIRMPRIDVRTAPGPGGAIREYARLTGYVDRGGRAEVASNRLGLVTRALVRGVVFDSVANAGLQGAVITLTGRSDSVVTGPDGQYALAVEAFGPQRVAASHPKLGLLGERQDREVILSLGDTITADFAVPAFPAFVRRLCGGPRGRAGVIGRAFRLDSAPGRGLVIEATTLVIGPSARSIRSVAEDNGLYALCDVPSGTPVAIRLRDRLATVQEEQIRLVHAEWRWLDLKPWGTRTETAVRPPVEIRSGPAVLTGVVRRDSTGQPIAGVEVLVERSEHRAVTDDSGRYLVGNLPTGRRVVLFRAIGYRPDRQWVNLPQGDTLWTNATLVPSVLHLDPVVVTAEQPGSRGVGLEGFEERRRHGFGKFLDSADLRRAEHVRLGDVIGRAGGLEVLRHGSRTVIAVSRRRVGPLGERCPASIWVDGVQFYRSPGPPIGASVEAPNLNDIMDVAQLVAVEVYSGSGEVPPEYGGASAACGVILLWTRRGP
ncbi:MAG: carboxypeptidase regulatory-like domain-containing protein [Gemmatimonadales bacterium]